VEDTWASRDLPVLEVVVSAFNDPEPYQLRIPELAGLAARRLAGPIIITDVTERAFLDQVRPLLDA
jgi:hypothetical protein